MKYVLPIAVLICVSVVYLAAQEEPPKDERVEFRGVLEDITLSELASYVQVQTGETISLDEQSGGKITFAGPTAGTKFDDDAFFLLLQDALGNHRFVLVPADEGWKSVPATEAASHAPAMSRAEISAAPDWQWAKIRIEVPGGNAQEVASACTVLGTRVGGKASSDGENAIELCDRVDRLREMLKLIKTVEVHDEPAEREYRAPAGLTDQEVIFALNEAFQRSPGLFVRVEITRDGFTVKVTGSSRVQKLAAQIIESLSE